MFSLNSVRKCRQQIGTLFIQMFRCKFEICLYTHINMIMLKTYKFHKYMKACILLIKKEQLILDNYVIFR